jgi:transposase-like protein
MRHLAGVARCPTCDHPAIAPLVATHLGAGRVQNDWTCSGCGFDWSDRFDPRAA